jgi:hypothetical protein
MSINLKCAEVDLWQTPTYITYMCYSNNDGGWQGILYRYIQWVKSHTNGVWKNPKDLEYMKECINIHINTLNSYKKLTFSII